MIKRGYYADQFTHILKELELRLQTVGLPKTELLPIEETGMYRVSGYGTCRKVGSDPVTITVYWVDDSGVEQSAPVDLDFFGVLTIRVLERTSVFYQTAIGGGGSATYDLFIRLEGI